MQLLTVVGGYEVERSRDMLLVTEGRGVLLPSNRAVCASSRTDEVAGSLPPRRDGLSERLSRRKGEIARIIDA